MLPTLHRAKRRLSFLSSNALDCDAAMSRAARDLSQDMNSAGHRANLLGNGWSRIAVGYVSCGGNPYWTQVFAD